MSHVRVLVGTRKGAFVLTSDGKRQHWDVGGPHFAGLEIYHLKGSPGEEQYGGTSKLVPFPRTCVSQSFSAACEAVPYPLPAPFTATGELL